MRVEDVTVKDEVSVILNPLPVLASKIGVAERVTTWVGSTPPPVPPVPGAPWGIVKFRTAAELVPLLVTATDVPAAPVVTVPTVTVAAAPAAPVVPAVPAVPAGPVDPAGPVEPVAPFVPLVPFVPSVPARARSCQYDAFGGDWFVLMRSEEHTSELQPL